MGGDFVLTARLGGGYAALLSPMETLRTAAWIGFLVALLRTSWALDERLIPSRADHDPCAHWRMPMDLMRSG
jgi:hypothetical protein